MLTRLLSQLKCCASEWLLMFWLCMMRTWSFSKMRVCVLYRQPRKSLLRRIRLECASLEDRCVPSTFVWRAQAAGNWNVQGNWEKTGTDAGDYPGHMFNGDIAIFRGTVSNNPATLNIVLPNNLNALQVESTYTSTVTLNNNLTAAGGFSKLESGTITGPSLFYIVGTFDWKGGTMSGTGATVFEPGTVVDVWSANTKTLDGRTINNRGIMNWFDSGNIVLNNNALIQTSHDIMNQPTAYFLARPNNGMILGSGRFFVDNLSIMRSEAADAQGNPQTAYIGSGVSFTMEGKLDINSGKMEVWGTTILHGDGNSATENDQIIIAANSELYLNGNQPVTLDGKEIFGTGNLRIAPTVNGTITGNVFVTNGVDWGTWTGTGNFHIRGSYGIFNSTWSGSGRLVVQGGGHLNIHGLIAGNNTINRTIENYSIITWRSGDITVSNAANINNNPGADFRIEANANIVNGGNAGVFTNFLGATVQRTGVNGTARIQIQFRNNGGNFIQQFGMGSIQTGMLFQNSGTVTVQGDGIDAEGGFVQDGGTLTVEAPFTVTGNLEQNGGTITASSGSFSVSEDFLLNSGTMDFEMGTTASITGQFLVSSGGLVRLSGVITVSGGMQINSGGTLESYYGAVTGNVVNFGTIDLHAMDAGTPLEYVLSITGNYTQNEFGSLVMDVDNWASDMLNITGSAEFDGTLKVLASEALYPPAFYTLIRYGSRVSGSEFDTYILPTPQQGTWGYAYDDINGEFVLFLEEW